MSKKSELTSNVRNYALREVGFDLLGIAGANDPQFDRAPEGHHPTECCYGADGTHFVRTHETAVFFDIRTEDGCKLTLKAFH